MFIKQRIFNQFQSIRKNKEPQINADKRRFVKTQRTAAPFALRYEKELQSRRRTLMTRIRRIFTDDFNPCVSVSSMQSVFYLDNTINLVSAFICVHLRLIHTVGLDK